MRRRRRARARPAARSRTACRRLIGSARPRSRAPRASSTHCASGRPASGTKPWPRSDHRRRGRPTGSSAKRRRALASPTRSSSMPPRLQRGAHARQHLVLLGACRCSAARRGSRPRRPAGTRSCACRRRRTSARVAERVSRALDVARHQLDAGDARRRPAPRPSRPASAPRAPRRRAACSRLASRPWPQPMSSTRASRRDQAALEQVAEHRVPAAACRARSARRSGRRARYGALAASTSARQARASAALDGGAVMRRAARRRATGAPAA